MAVFFFHATSSIFSVAFYARFPIIPLILASARWKKSRFCFIH